jgi:hypothetical protein
VTRPLTAFVTSSSSQARGLVGKAPLALPRFFRYFPPAVAKVYIVSFRTLDERRPSKFIVVATNMRAAINKAWEHGGADSIAVRQVHSTSPGDEGRSVAGFMINEQHDHAGFDKVFDTSSYEERARRKRKRNREPKSAKKIIANFAILPKKSLEVIRWYS